ILCFHVLRVMEILHVEELLAKHILKRWTKDARDILPQHLVQYQRDNPVNLSFTCKHSTLCLKAMDVVRLGAFDHIYAGLDALMVSGASFAERRDGLGFEDRMVGLVRDTLPGNGLMACVGNEIAEKCISTGNFVSVNALHGLTVPEEQRGVQRPTNSREKAPYEGLSKSTRFCNT
uniref:Protein FAR1-RELATED SEQUENCE n=1 Tax=Aegilops tauschii subsp. strangulata TaxID=200361 RepID=A0A452YJK4_AEGTS